MYTVWSLMPCFLATAGTEPASASRTIRTICSAVNLDFLTPPRFRGAIFSSVKWSEKRQAGHCDQDTPC